MDDEELLKRIGEAAREEERERGLGLDPSWPSLGANGLTQDEQRDLLALVAKAGPEAREVLRPLDLKARLLERPGPTPARLPKRNWSGFLWPSLAIAAAAVLVMLWFRPGPLPPLPAYSLTLSSGVQEFREAAEPPANLPRFGPGTLLQILLRPARTVSDPVAAQVFVEEGPELRPLALPIEVDRDGAVRIRAQVGRDLRLVPGVYTLWITVGRPDGPATADEVRAAPPGVVVHRVAIQVTEE